MICRFKLKVALMTRVRKGGKETYNVQMGALSARKRQVPMHLYLAEGTIHDIRGYCCFRPRPLQALSPRALGQGPVDQV